MKKQIGIMKEVYDELREYRDKNGFPSFTEAIRALLVFRKSIEHYQYVDHSGTITAHSVTAEFTHKVNDEDIEANNR